MRKSLQHFYHGDENVPHTYKGRLCDFSLRRSKQGYYVVVADVCLDSGEWISDHLWITLDVLPGTIGLSLGDTIQFSGIVCNYQKCNGTMDYSVVAAQESVTRSIEALN